MGGWFSLFGGARGLNKVTGVMADLGEVRTVPGKINHHHHLLFFVHHHLEVRTFPGKINLLNEVFFLV